MKKFLISIVFALSFCSNIAATCLLTKADVLPVKMINNQEDLAILRTKCAKVKKFNEQLAKDLDDLRDTLNAQADGAGIAANQVGLCHLRAVVLYKDVRGKLIYTDSSNQTKDPRLQDQPLELINPEIIATNGEQIVIEGCFSIPFLVIIPRPKYIKVKAYDRYGREFTLELNEAMADGDQSELSHILFSTHLICHECEHLDGILCIDKAIVKDIPQSIEIEDLRQLLTSEREKYFKIGI